MGVNELKSGLWEAPPPLATRKTLPCPHPPIKGYKMRPALTWADSGTLWDQAAACFTKAST